MKMDSELSGNLDLLGLSDYELRTFAAATELGSGSAALLAKRARIPRASVYPVLSSLADKGLVSVEKRKGANVFIPSSPEKLVVIAEEKLKQAEQGVKISKRVAEALQSPRARDAFTSAKILIFEGKRSIDQMLEERTGDWRKSAIEYGKEWMGFQDASFLKHYGQSVIDYWKKYRTHKDWQKDRLKLFSEENEDTKRVAELSESMAGDRRQLKPLPSGSPFSTTLWIIGEYVIVIKTRAEPHYALQIRDQVLAENLATVFEFAWDLAGEEKKGRF